MATNPRPVSPPSPPGNGHWESIGLVSVDSGTLSVVDPCYVIDKGSEIYHWGDWDKLFQPYCNNLGVQFSAGYGDGQYEVWAYFIPDDGGRVAEVRVCMISEDGFDDER